MFFAALSCVTPHIRCACLCSPKSTAAAKAAKGLNNALKVTALQNRVSPATEDVFHDKFWESLDLVVNALDNVNARLYVDSRCVYFGKPLLESGTLGPKCNTQVVMPNMTENYGRAELPCLARSTLHAELILNTPNPVQTWPSSLKCSGTKSCWRALYVSSAVCQCPCNISRVSWSNFALTRSNWLVCGALLRWLARNCVRLQCKGFTAIQF